MADNIGSAFIEIRARFSPGGRGSQGALALNKMVPKALSRLPQEMRPIVRHQAGSLTIDAARHAYEQESIEAELVPFIEDMADAYAWADLVVDRKSVV